VQSLTFSFSEKVGSRVHDQERGHCFVIKLYDDEHKVCTVVIKRQ
jgi:hypothetical protein